MGPISPWKGAQQPPPLFSAHVYCDQTVAKRSPMSARALVGRPLVKLFAPYAIGRTVVCLSVSVLYRWCIVAKRLGGSRCHLVRTTEVGLGPGHIVLDGEPSSLLPQRRTAVPHFSSHVYFGQMVGWIRIPLGKLVRSSLSFFCNLLRQIKIISRYIASLNRCGRV